MVVQAFMRSSGPCVWTNTLKDPKRSSLEYVRLQPPPKYRKTTQSAVISFVLLAEGAGLSRQSWFPTKKSNIKLSIDAIGYASHFSTLWSSTFFRGLRFSKLEQSFVPFRYLKWVSEQLLLLQSISSGLPGWPRLCEGGGSGQGSH